MILFPVSPHKNIKKATGNDVLAENSKELVEK